MHLPLTILTNLIIDTYFNESRCIYLFTDAKNQFEYFGNIPNVIQRIGNDEMTPNLMFNHFGCQGFIINVAKPKSIFQNIEDNIRLTMERFNFRKYLFIPQETAIEDVTEVFQSEAVQFVADVIAISQNKTDIKENPIYDILTHKYSGIQDHDNVVVLDKWYSANYSFEFGGNLYPNKLLNQFGRTLRLGTIDYVPYSIIDSLDGLDISILMELAKKLNMTVKLVLDLTVQWGKIYSNFTGNGILGNVAMDRTDVGFGSMFIWEAEYHYLDISKQTIKSSISCLVPGPNLVGGWATPFIAFNAPIWAVFAFSAVLSITALYFALSWHNLYSNLNNENNTKSKCYYLTTSILLAEAMYLNQSLSRIPQHFSTRLVFSMILVMSLVLGAIYDSGLASNMTIPR